jgi:hypothetical protein
MKVTNMKELLEYVANKQKERSHQHYEVAKLYGPCSGMGNRRYKVNQKSTFRKGKSYAYNKKWIYTN